MKKVGIICSSALVFLIGIAIVKANTIDIFTITFSNLASLKTTYSSNITANYETQSIKLAPTRILTDSETGTYLSVTAQQKNTLGTFKDKCVNTVANPKVGNTQTQYCYDMDTGTYRYKIYNYGILEADGTVTLNIYN